jgi:hypothetical protein
VAQDKHWTYWEVDIESRHNCYHLFNSVCENILEAKELLAQRLRSDRKMILKTHCKVGGVMVLCCAAFMSAEILIFCAVYIMSRHFTREVETESICLFD